MSDDYSAVREGMCPVHRTPLERHDDYGWCPDCGLGWSTRPGEISIHLRPRIPERFQ